MNRPLIVLGAQRTGTSLTAQILKQWGAHYGEDDEISRQAGEANPGGFWEYLPLVRFQQDFANACPIGRYEPEYDQHIASLAENGPWRDKALALLERMDDLSRGGTWFWKFPEYALMLGFWSVIIPNPVYVVTIRHPVDAACSMAKEWVPGGLKDAAMPMPATLLLWQHYMHMILRYTENAPDKHFVSYENLVRSPNQECARLARFLDHSYSEQSDSECLDRMTAVVEPRYWRNNAPEMLDREPAVTETLRSTYRCMLAKVEAPHAPVDWAALALDHRERALLTNTALLFSHYRLIETLQDRLQARPVRWALRASRLWRGLLRLPRRLGSR